MRLRTLLGILLILVGVAIAGFFAFLLAIADCSAACEANGERAPALALIATGAGFVVAGIGLARRHSGARASGWGLLVAGGGTILTVIAFIAMGAVSGLLLATLGAGVLVAAIGLALLAWGPRAKRP